MGSFAMADSASSTAPRYTPVLLVFLQEKKEQDKQNGEGEKVIKSIEETIRWGETVAEADEDDLENPDALKILGFLVTVPGPGPGAFRIFSRQCNQTSQHAKAIKELKMKIKSPALPVVWEDTNSCPLCAMLEKDEQDTRIPGILTSKAVEKVN